MMDHTEHEAERLEQLRQAVMRMRELLDIMHSQLDEAEQRYADLFAHLTLEVKQSTPEKTLQGMAAQRLLEESTEPLARAAMTLRFHGRTMEREFDALYGNIVQEQVD